MRNWKNINIETPEVPVTDEQAKNQKLTGIQRMYHRACGRKRISAAVRKLYVITEARFKTDGYATIVVVTLRKQLFGDVFYGHPIYGYGMSVRARGDKFREEIGVNNALGRALESAATRIGHEITTT